MNGIKSGASGIIGTNWQRVRHRKSMASNPFLIVTRPMLFATHNALQYVIIFEEQHLINGGGGRIRRIRHKAKYRLLLFRAVAAIDTDVSNLFLLLQLKLKHKYFRFIKVHLGAGRSIQFCCAEVHDNK
jgi:hypothetical protein